MALSQGMLENDPGLANGFKNRYIKLLIVNIFLQFANARIKEKQH